LGLDDGTTADAAAVVVAVVVGLGGLTKGTSRRDISLRGEDAVFAESAVVFEDLPFEDGLLLWFDVLFSISNLVLTSLRPKDATFCLSEASLDIFIKLLVLLTGFCGCEPILFTVAVVVVIAVNAVAADDGMGGCLIGLGLTAFIEDGLIAAAVVVGLFVVWFSFGFLTTSLELWLFVGEVLLRPLTMLLELLLIGSLDFGGGDLAVEVGLGSNMFHSLTLSRSRCGCSF